MRKQLIRITIRGEKRPIVERLGSTSVALTGGRVLLAFRQYTHRTDVVREVAGMSDKFTEKQGQYLAFIDSYMTMYGRAPAEADLQRFFRSTPPTVHQMILKLEEKGLISRVPGEARSIKLLVDRQEIPRLNRPEGNG